MQQEKVYRTDFTPLSFLRRSAIIYPDKTAVVHGDRRYTYRQFEERVNRFAARLRADGSLSTRSSRRCLYPSTRRA